MTTKQAKHQRIVTLTNMAISGKYTWKDLREKCRTWKLSEPTVKSYLDELDKRLKKAGYRQ